VVALPDPGPLRIGPVDLPPGKGSCPAFTATLAWCRSSSARWIARHTAHGTTSRTTVTEKGFTA
jgi:hypothetical protein